MYRVVLVPEAEDDLVDIYRFLATHESVERAEAILSRLEEVCRGLSDKPKRGRIPPETERIGVSGYREVFSRPWRIFYFIEGGAVQIVAVLDGRRDLHAALARRMLR